MSQILNDLLGVFRLASSRLTSEIKTHRSSQIKARLSPHPYLPGFTPARGLGLKEPGSQLDYSRAQNGLVFSVCVDREEVHVNFKGICWLTCLNTAGVCGCAGLNRQDDSWMLILLALSTHRLL